MSLASLDRFVIPVGPKKYKGKKLQDVPLRELDTFLGEMESWGPKYQTSMVAYTIVTLKQYLSDPVIAEELERELGD